MIFAFCILLAGNLVAGGFLFEQFLGTSYAFGVLLIVAVVLAYTMTGGMFSDAYTAFIQMVITVAATAALLVWVASTYGISIPDGMGPFDVGQLTDPAQGATINWANLIALGVGDIVAIDFMQRFSARSPEIARRACFTAALAVSAVGIPYALVALTAPVILGGDMPETAVLYTILSDHAPTGLAIMVLSGIVAASCSTANGAILGTAAVVVRNIAGYRIVHTGEGPDPQLRAVRLTMLPVVAVAIVIALRVPQTGILLTLAFDVMLACLLVPFVAAHFWHRATPRAAMAAILAGGAVRVVLFALTPTIYGVENSLLYVENSLIGPGFDGWPTFIGLATSVVTLVVVTLVAPGRRSPVELEDLELAERAQELTGRPMVPSS
jgi:SSS family solute:Na+ symporter